MKTRLFAASLAVLYLLVALGVSLADSGALSAFTAKYGSAGINNCSLCHTSAPALNPYGAAVAPLPVSAAQLASAESADSDGDGFTNIAEINAGTYPGDPASKPASPPPPVACAYTYSAWAACQPGGTQTRTVVSSTPAGCTGTPVLTQPCTYTVPPSACTYTYSSWSTCQPDNTQTRTVVSSIPAGCTGTPVLTQPCTPASPPPGTSPMDLPGGRHVYTYGPIADPVVSTDPAHARPLGIGTLATGGDVLDLKIQVGPFTSPVDVSLGIYAASFDARDVYFLDMTRQLITAAAVTTAAHEDEKDSSSADRELRKKVKKLMLWKEGVTEVNESVFGQIPAADLGPGLYVVHLGISPVSDDDENHNSYRWITYFIVP